MPAPRIKSLSVEKKLNTSILLTDGHEISCIKSGSALESRTGVLKVLIVGRSRIGSLDCGAVDSEVHKADAGRYLAGEMFTSWEISSPDS
jgi:hypothetical protein